MRVNLPKILENENHIIRIRQELKNILYAANDSPLRLHQRSQSLLYHVKDSIEQTTRIIDFLDTTIERYEQVETQLRFDAQNLSSKNQWSTQWNQFAHSGNFNNQSKFSLRDKLTLGGTLTGTASFSFYHAWKKYKKGNIESSLNFNVGYANVFGKCNAVLFQKNQFQPNINIDIEAKAALANANGKVAYKTKYFGVQADGAIDVGVINASAKARITQEEITLKADYGVAAVSGKAHGRITLFGFHLDTTLEGEMLAIGGGAEFSKGKKYVEVGGKLSLFAGLGFKIRISRD